MTTEKEETRRPKPVRFDCCSIVNPLSFVIRITQACVHPMRIKPLVENSPNGHAATVYLVVNRLMKPIRKSAIVTHALGVYTCGLFQLIDLANHIITKAQPKTKLKLVVKVTPANNIHHCGWKNVHFKRLAGQSHQTAPTRKARAVFQGIGRSTPAATRSSVALSSRSCHAGNLTSSETESDDQM